MLSRNAFILFLIGWFIFSFAWILTDQSGHYSFITGDVTAEARTPEVELSQAPVEPNLSTKEFSIESGHVMIGNSSRPVPRFLTDELTVNKGDRVIIHIKNIRGRHDFKIDEFDVYSETPEGDTVTVEFIADQAGDFVYYCTKPNHRKNGHWGTLHVIDNS